jgi:hypothetical protein
MALALPVSAVRGLFVFAGSAEVVAVPEPATMSVLALSIAGRG